MKLIWLSAGGAVHGSGRRQPWSRHHVHRLGKNCRKILGCEEALFAIFSTGYTKKPLTTEARMPVGLRTKLVRIFVR